MARFDWTPEKLEALAVYWKAGRTSTSIAAEFGTSRSAVMGKINRLGLMGTPRDGKDPRNVNGEHKTAKENRKKSLEVFMENPDTDNRDNPEPEKLEIIAVPAMEPTAPIRKTVLTLMSGDCRWPLDQMDQQSLMIFCGDPTFNSEPYCEEHCKRAFQNWPLGTRR